MRNRQVQPELDGRGDLGLTVAGTSLTIARAITVDGRIVGILVGTKAYGFLRDPHGNYELIEAPVPNPAVNTMA